MVFKITCVGSIPATPDLRTSVIDLHLPLIFHKTSHFSIYSHQIPLLFKISLLNLSIFYKTPSIILFFFVQQFYIFEIFYRFYCSINNKNQQNLPLLPLSQNWGDHYSFFCHNPIQSLSVFLADSAKKHINTDFVSLTTNRFNKFTRYCVQKIKYILKCNKFFNKHKIGKILYLRYAKLTVQSINVGKHFPRKLFPIFSHVISTKTYDIEDIESRFTTSSKLSNQTHFFLLNRVKKLFTDYDNLVTTSHISRPVGYATPNRLFSLRRTKSFKSFLTPLLFSTFPHNLILNYFSSYILWKFILFHNSWYYSVSDICYNLTRLLDKFYLTQTINLKFNNILPHIKLNYIIYKKFTQYTFADKMSSGLGLWYNVTMIRFIENCTGNKALFRVYAFINSYLNYAETSRCLLWTQRVRHFKKVIGTGLFLGESVRIIYISLKLKDPHFLINWMRQTLQKISFWKFRTFFYFIRYLFRYFFVAIFSELKVKGIKFRIKGKISVAGNSRTRTVVHTIGKTSQSTMSNRIIQVNDLVRTFTGVIGFRLWLVF